MFFFFFFIRQQTHYLYNSHPTFEKWETKDFRDNEHPTCIYNPCVFVNEILWLIWCFQIPIQISSTHCFVFIYWFCRIKQIFSLKQHSKYEENPSGPINADSKNTDGINRQQMQSACNNSWDLHKSQITASIHILQ